MLRKPRLYQQVIFLRQKGFSYNEILQVVPVGKGTISRWCQHITLTKEQKERLVQKQRNTKLIKTLVRKANLDKQEARGWAKEHTKQIKTVNPTSKLIILGAALYWAEGTKFSKNSPRIEFTNTDPRIIKLMLKFFEEILSIPLTKVKIMVRINKNGDIYNAIRYWSKITSVPIKNFQKPELLRLSQNSKSLDKHPYGICRLTINNISTARKVHHLINYLYKDFIYDKLKKLQN